MNIDPRDQVEQVAVVFGSKSKLAAAIGLGRQAINEWKRKEIGVPSTQWRAIAIAARERELKLPKWFPIFPDLDDKAA